MSSNPQSTFMLYLDYLFENYLSGVPVNQLGKLSALSTMNNVTCIYMCCIQDSLVITND